MTLRVEYDLIKFVEQVGNMHGSREYEKTGKEEFQNSELDPANLIGMRVMNNNSHFIGVIKEVGDGYIISVC